MFTACPPPSLPARRFPDRENRIRSSSHIVSVRRVFVIVLALTVLLLTHAPAAAAEDKTDVVVMNNGDRFVGEIKQLGFGQLQFKASYMASSVNLDWTKVIQLASTRRFRVEFADGMLASGSITKSNSAAAGADFEVTEDSGMTTRGALEVVAMEPIEGSLWRRFRGSADIGLTLQPEVGQTTWTANGTVEYPAEHFRVDSQVSSYFDSYLPDLQPPRKSISIPPPLQWHQC